MAILEQNVMPQFADKAELRRIMDEQYALMGFTYDPTATAERAQAMFAEAGFDPNDNSFSRGIIEAREEKVRGSLEGWDE